LVRRFQRPHVTGEHYGSSVKAFEGAHLPAPTPGRVIFDQLKHELVGVREDAEVIDVQRLWRRRPEHAAPFRPCEEERVLCAVVELSRLSAERHGLELVLGPVTTESKVGVKIPVSSKATISEIGGQFVTNVA